MEYLLFVAIGLFICSILMAFYNNYMHWMRLQEKWEKEYTALQESLNAQYKQLKDYRTNQVNIIEED